MVGIHFEGNQIHAGRIAALTSLNNTVTIEASRNDFTFRQALLSFAGYPGTEAWRRGTVWHGGDNRYHGSPDWLMLEGNPAGVHGLAEWRTLWSQPERRSLARTSLSASQSSESSVPMDD